ncbi:MAG: hypothetical protein AAF755_03375 [Pseudomonadota bacterium]
MSETNSFIDEVNEEVRRDRVLGLMRRYGWIAVLAIFAVVGAAAWNEYQKAQDRAAAEELGDATRAALAQGGSAVDALEAIETDDPLERVFLQLSIAEQYIAQGGIKGALTALDAISLSADAPEVYRQLAQFQALTLRADTMSTAELRAAFEPMAQPGHRFRLVAIEQLALLDIKEANGIAALDRFQSIFTDAGATPELRDRARQMIFALGGRLESERFEDYDALVNGE